MALLATEFALSFFAFSVPRLRVHHSDSTEMVLSQIGFYANVGPLEVFVSKQLIPGDYKFDPVGQVRPFHAPIHSIILSVCCCALRAAVVL